VENTYKKEEYLAYSSGVALADDAGEVWKKTSEDIRVAS
jgi:hypothetical protein